MYHKFLLAKVRAKREHDGVSKVFLSEAMYDRFRGDDRWVRPDTPENAPVRFGFSGDFTVEETDSQTSYVLCDNGAKIAFESVGYDDVVA